MSNKNLIVYTAKVIKIEERKGQGKDGKKESKQKRNL